MYVHRFSMMGVDSEDSKVKQLPAVTVPTACRNYHNVQCVHVYNIHCVHCTVCTTYTVYIVQCVHTWAGPSHSRATNLEEEDEEPLVPAADMLEHSPAELCACVI